jgi:uncharacterized protein (TIGR02099 family)
LERPFFHRLGNVLWVGIVVLLVTLAVYVSVGRVLVTNVSSWHTEILQALNARGPFVVEAERIRGEWRSFSPVLVLSGLRLSIPDSLEPPLQLSEGRATVDVPNSLRTGVLQLSRIALEDLSLNGELTGDGALRFEGLGAAGDEDGGDIRDFLLNVEAITLRNNRLVLTLPDGEVRNMDLDLSLSRDGSHRQVDARLTSTRGAVINVLAEGVGDPFSPEYFSGQVYADFRSTDLGAVKDLVAEPALPLWADGAVDAQVWFDWDRGVPALQARLEGGDLLLVPRDGAWQLTLDTLRLQAGLQREGDRWQLFVSDLQAGRGETTLHLPRIQLEREGNAVQARAAGLSLDSVGTFVGGLDVVPEVLRDVLAGLRPRGELTGVQLRVDDLDEPQAGWEVRAGFEQLAVESYKGAPGARMIAGYAQLGPGGGRVLLDSQQVLLDFPQVYSDPLRFDDLYGSLHFRWDDDIVRLDSGLLTTEGEEGTARVLFGLDIPRRQTDTGIEMDLLVGLQNSHPTHRAKYIPSVLNPALTRWLEDSIGEGVIEQGAFLWRGSLKKDAGALRTVQMAFNVSDTHLAYHPRWPPVLVREGIVVIDDTQASVWAQRADLFRSAVRSLSVETWVNEARHIELAVRGSVSGPAADGLKVLNESPLSGIVGEAFADWELDGGLDTELDLHMNLSDSSVPPEVEVATRWQDVDMTILPGNLPVRGVTGEFDYSTATGFSSRSLQGQLWGKAVNAELSQRHVSKARGYDPSTSVVQVALATEVDMKDIVAWLQLDLLQFASGRTAVDVGLAITPGEPPLLAVDSTLLGVSLDLPRPWRKVAAEEQALHLELPLGEGVMPLALQVGAALGFRFDLEGGRVRGGALGINRQPPEPGQGELLVAGRAPLVPVDEWLDFVERYMTGDAPSSVPAAPEPDTPAAGVASEVTDEVVEAVAEPELGITLDRVLAETFLFRGQEFRNVSLGLGVEPALVHLSLDADWLGARLFLPRESGPAQLDVDYLDLDRLPPIDTVNLEAQVEREEPSASDLPRVNVTLANIFQSERRLGDLAFALSGRDGVVTVENITGEVARLRLPPERAARLTWQQGENELTEVSASLRFADLGDTLAEFGYQRTVETTAGRIDLDLQWPGAPHEPSLRLAQGAIDVNIESGSFLEASSGAQGALRVVSILNLADIVRRLSLSHMFESGIPFDSVRGEIYLHGGTVEVAYMDVKGGSSFYFSGVSEVASQSLSGELVATLPVANNLPWIAALAASLPVAAGVFVVSQVFNKQVNRLSSAVYSIDGTWNEPEVKFDRIFDNTEKGVGGGRAAGAVDFQSPGFEPPYSEPPDVEASPPAQETPDQPASP